MHPVDAVHYSWYATPRSPPTIEILRSSVVIESQYLYSIITANRD